MTSKVKVGAPYMQRLLNDQDVQDRLGRALSSGRDAYGRARGKKVAEAIQDRKLQRRIFESLNAAREAWVAVEAPPQRRKRWLLPALIALAFVGIGAAVVLKRQPGAEALPAFNDNGSTGSSDNDSAAPAGSRGVPVAEPPQEA